MRIVKSSWGLTGLVGLTIGLVLVADRGMVRAQLPAPNPLVAPLPAPSGPRTLAAPVQALAVPSLAAVPTVPAPTPTPSLRAFNCSCFGPGTSTRWMGQVSAPSYFAARQAATGACLTYNERKEPPAAVVPTPPANPAGPAMALPQGFEGLGAAGSTGAALPGGLSISTASALKGCAQCACD
jgi:hypothetical protein